MKIISKNKKQVHFNKNKIAKKHFFCQLKVFKIKLLNFRNINQPKKIIKKVIIAISQIIHRKTLNQIWK